MADQKKRKLAATVSPAERTSSGLRAVLFEELDGLRNGVITSTRANAVAKIATTIVETVRMELDVMNFSHKNKVAAGSESIPLNKPLRLVK